MDVAIRAANWVAALALCAEEAAGEPWFEPVLESLLLHGRFIRSHLEWSEARGNHYLSDVVGLLAVAALFSGGREGKDWAEWAAGELVAEMEHQVRPDGSEHEASIPYHRLVTELFVCGTQAADALVPGSLPDWYRERLELMLALRRATTRGRTASRRRSATPTTAGSCRSATTAPTRATTGTSSPRRSDPTNRRRRAPPTRTAATTSCEAATSTRSSAAATSVATGEEATATTTSSRSSSPRAVGRS